MASIAFEGSGSRDTSRLPVSLHPAFPAVVALWFAALLGVGSILLPLVLIERIVEMTGLAALVPAASPPLGLVARGLIALISAAAGGAIGVAIARRVARSHEAARPSRVAKFGKGARRPINVNEELGGEGVVNGFGLPVSRRRALAIAEDDRPSDFLYMAPLPGDEQDAPASAFDVPPIPATEADEPFELSDAFEDAAEAGELEALESHAAARPNEDPPMTFEPEYQPLSPEAGAESRQEFMPAPSKGRASPLPFSAPSLARRAVQEDALLPEPGPEPAISELELDEVEPHEPMQFEPARAVSEPQPFRGDWSNAPLDELGLVQLVQRLGASLERRRELLACAVANPPAPQRALPTGFDAAPAEEAAQAMAAYFNKSTGDAPAIPDARDSEGGQRVSVAPVDPAPLPNFLGSWPTADDDDFDAMPSFTLPLRKAVSPTIAFDDPERPENDDDVEDVPGTEPSDSYSSLLTMRNPFAPKDDGFVRVEEPAADDDAVEPTVVFPGHRDAALPPMITGQAGARVFDPPAGAGANSARIGTAPADADAALRAALATLQRMSGTA